MSATADLVRRVLDEEIERHGSWWPTENCWHVVRGKGHDGKKIDQVTPTLEATSKRTGMPMERLQGAFRCTSALMQPGGYLTTSREHHNRRLAEGSIRRIDKSTDTKAGVFEVYEPVPGPRDGQDQCPC